ncbi:P-loop ATPase, Sll1717 family [Paradevosia shaoguanensis]|uniref:P-loop ATPase, Sll1717 family n=1 Tax=Paradevosia shaoguanensis TaxID=1335043 RepID=UPI001932B80C|nr:hypothetical protein [Paradevosia shaoguanensis]
MASRFSPVFFAYPGQPQDLGSTIEAAARYVNNGQSSDLVLVWPEMGVFGQIIPDTVRDNIKHAKTLVFDITKPNPNVYYEAGFALGLGKTIAPVINASFADSVAQVQKDGLFDSVGYRTYENSESLATILRNLPESSLLTLYSREVDTSQPLFVLDTLHKTDFRNAIVSAVKASKVHFRSFDPVEVARFSAVSMIAQVSSSSGVVLPLLPSHIADHDRHNLRAAFIAGICHGLERSVLLLQQRHFSDVNPADIREFVTPVTDDKAIGLVVEDFSKAALVASQSITRIGAKRKRTALQQITLGASAAENEFRTLANYFVETAEFGKTLRGEVNVVAGRKGSGKTAIFFQARDNFREDRSVFVTDLKPESHQLSLFREELRKIVDVGSFDHTLAAFWYFLLLTEVVLTMKREFDFRSRHDQGALEAVNDIDHWVEAYQIGDSGDFTTRINRLGRFIIQEIEAAKRKRQTISPEFLTNVIFRGGVTELKKVILKHSSTKSSFVLLFDNIDKGWPTNGVDEFDVRLVRLLIETLDKIKRDLASSQREFHSVVFLRNDIYELLVNATPDRGKAGQVRIDWTDRAKLKQVIFKRLQSNTKSTSKNFEQLWREFFPQLVDGQDSFDFLVDHCLMRPRFLINIIENAISNGINRGHQAVDQQDCIDAVRQHSLYLIDDFGFEIQDVSGIASDILYSLVGSEKAHTKADFIKKFEDFGLGQDDAQRAFTLMMWYGVIGLKGKDGRDRYIYDFEYNAKRLEAEAKLMGADGIYVTNPALHVALSS